MGDGVHIEYHLRDLVVSGGNRLLRPPSARRPRRTTATGTDCHVSTKLRWDGDGNERRRSREADQPGGTTKEYGSVTALAQYARSETRQKRFVKVRLRR